MELTQIEKKLIRTLMQFDIGEEEQEAVFLEMREEPQQMMMLQFLEKNKTATQNDILKEMLRICRMTE